VKGRSPARTPCYSLTAPFLLIDDGEGTQTRTHETVSTPGTAVLATGRTYLRMLMRSASDDRAPWAQHEPQ
jgi:hypothetical protein